MSIEIILISFQVGILIMSVVAHEVAHGWMALQLGDGTAKRAGRLTLNPISHLDPWGSVLIPLLMIFTFGFGFGWAKPVPYNPYNLRDQRRGPAWVALAGPGMNFLLAILAGLIARFIPLSLIIKEQIVFRIFDFKNLSLLLSGSYQAIFFWLCLLILIINVFLAVFNLIPVPPLDGSKLLFAFGNLKQSTVAWLEQFGFIFLLILIFIFSAPLNYLLSGILGLFLKIIVGL